MYSCPCIWQHLLSDDWLRTSTFTLSTTGTLSELQHAVGLLCTRVTVTVAVYFERVCVYVFVLKSCARHSLMSVLVLVDLTLWWVCYNCDECTHVPTFDNICSVMINWRTSTLTLSTTITLSELLHAVGLLCTRVTVTVAVYFQRVCVYVL